MYQSTNYQPVHPSARERTSAGFLRAGLSVGPVTGAGPASLSGSLRLLLSVIAFGGVSCRNAASLLARIMPQNGGFVKFDNGLNRVTIHIVS